MEKVELRISQQDIEWFEKYIAEMRELYAAEDRDDWFDADDLARDIAEKIDWIIQENMSIGRGSKHVPKDWVGDISDIELETYKAVSRKLAASKLKVKMDKLMNDGLAIEMTREQFEWMVEELLMDQSTLLGMKDWTDWTKRYLGYGKYIVNAEDVAV